jgi:hypothetical protein
MDFINFASKQKMIRRKSEIFLIGLLVIVLASCSPLTHTQVRNARDFYAAVQPAGQNCLILKNAAALVTYKREQLYPGSYRNDSLMVNELIEAHTNYQSSVSAYDSVLVAVNAINGYVSKYQKYFPEFKQVKTPNKISLRAVEDISSYFPLGLGTMVYKIMYDIIYYTKYFLSLPWGKKNMKKYMLEGADILPKNIAIIRRHLPQYMVRLEKEQQKVKENYLQFLKNQTTQKEPSDYYFRYNPEFLSILELSKTTSYLAAESELSLSSVDTAYKRLLFETAERKRIKGFLPEIQKMEFRLSVFSTKTSKVQELMGKK